MVYARTASVHMVLLFPLLVLGVSEVGDGEGSRPMDLRREVSRERMWSAPSRWMARKVREKSTVEAAR